MSKTIQQEQKQDMYTIVYNHLTDLYSKMYFSLKPVLSIQERAIISATAYAEMIQMAQQGYIYDYYQRIQKGAL